jgi:hypothetical protein
MTARLHALDLSRRRLLLAAGIGIGVGLTGAGRVERANAATAKLTQSAANYQPRPRGNQRCNTCSQWIQPTDCKVVLGPISPTGWCSLFAPKWN